MHGREQRVDEFQVCVLGTHQSDLAAHAGEPVFFETWCENRERLRREFDRALLDRIDQWQQGFSEAREIPAPRVYLVRIGITSVAVDRTKYLCGIVGVQTRAGSKIDRLARDRHVVGIY